MSFLKFFNNIKLHGFEYYKKYYAIYKAFVFNNEDPKNLGRVQVKVPQIYGENEYEYWARPKGIYSGNKTGSFFIPNKGDKVWIEFENGDAKFPVWSYGWWVEEQVPDGATIQNKIIQTTSGNKIELDDENELIRITIPSGKVFEINKEGLSLGSADISSEKAVLGDTLKNKLDKLTAELKSILDAIKLITVPTGTGPSGTPINALSFTNIKNKIVSLESEMKEVLSQIITLD